MRNAGKGKEGERNVDLTVPRVIFHEESFLRRWSGRAAQRKRVTPKNIRGARKQVDVERS